MFKLRELKRKDLEAINSWRNDPELIKLLGAPFRYINLDVDNMWYDSYLTNRKTAVRCAITEDDYDDIIGLVSLTDIDYLNQTAQLHIMIGDVKNRSRGAGTFATKEMVNHAFNNMNLHRVELAVLEENVNARRMYEKVGFVREGIKRSNRYKNGRFVNSVMYSVLKEDFQAAVTNECPNM